MSHTNQYEKIEKYIKTEKELSLYKISILNKINKPYRKRLLKKEKEFVEFDFSLIKFNTLNEAKSAVSLYKTSKNKFFNKYLLENKNIKINIANIVIKILENKINSIDISDNRIDNFYFLSLSKKLPFRESGELKKIYLKRIVNMKLLLAFTIFYLKDNPNISIEDIDYCLYNKIHFYFSKISEYKNNINNYINEESIIDEISDYYFNIFNEYDLSEFKLLKKTEKTNLLIFPIKHCGNERIKPLYSKIILNKKIINPRHLKFSNYPLNGEYFKCLKIDCDLIKGEDVCFNGSILMLCKARREMENNNEIKLWYRYIVDSISEEIKKEIL